MKPLAEVVRVVEFAGIRLASLETQVRKGKQGSANLGIKTGVSAPELTADKMQFGVACILEVGTAEHEQESAALWFKGVFHLSYRLRDSSLTPEDLQEFVEKNVLFNAWPFFRELLLSTSQRMECDPIVLPLFRLGNLKPEQSATADAATD